jgi:hypothetical protein
MSQQFGIVIMVDVKAALKTMCLKDHIYLIDNMRDFGSKNEGTNALISQINATYWQNGKQAGEAVMNWLALDINDLPRTVQKTSHYKNKSTENLLKKFLSSKGKKVSNSTKNAATNLQEIETYLKEIENRTRRLSVNPESDVKIKSDWPLMNTKGQLIENSEYDEAKIINLPPIVTNITGEAVDKKIIFPGQYGSPMFSSNGWYWCASINTATAGKYKYKVHVTLFEHIRTTRDEPAYWKPVEMTFDSNILISRDAMKNGFTGAGDPYLPIY